MLPVLLLGSGLVALVVGSQAVCPEFGLWPCNGTVGCLPLVAGVCYFLVFVGVLCLVALFIKSNVCLFLKTVANNKNLCNTGL